MNPQNPSRANDKIALPDIPALTLNARQAFVLSSDGELQTLTHDRAKTVLHKHSVLLCHAPYIRARLGEADFHAFDLLELFAFVHPGMFCVPTPIGLCKTLGLPAPENHEDAPLSLFDIAQALLRDLRKDPWSAKADPLKIAASMGQNGKGWGWTPFIFSALGQTYEPALPVESKSAFGIWKNLPEWAEDPPEPPPSHYGVTEVETRERLQKMIGFDREHREEQIQYALEISKIFAPPEAAPVTKALGIENENIRPHIVLAEAGTGVGKTLGYLAPASLWAEKNKGSVWISTYTKNLQRQIGQELDRLYPDPTLKEAHVATRKGRENYLCLLNFEEMAAGAALSHHRGQMIAAGIMARWAAITKDGDLSGADFPGWLTGLLGYAFTQGLADRRGECIYSACDHYHKCFIEHSARKSKRARIVVANHALVLIQSALSTPGDDMPTRYIFDEGHHLFDAADGAFAAHLSGMETRDLRRWISGPEGGRRNSRARGLKKRAEDLCEGMPEAQDALHKALDAAEALTSDGWTRRLKDANPSGPCEHFLLEVYRQVFARAQGTNGPYSLETQTHPADEALKERAQTLKSALIKLQKPMQELARIFRKKLAADEGLMEPDTRRRLDAVSNAIERRAVMELGAWIKMLENLCRPETTESQQDFIDWLAIERENGQAFDVGLYRHHVDPMRPFAKALSPHLHGMAVTSATLRDASDNTGNTEESWGTARLRTGAQYLSSSIEESAFASPFDYANRTKVFIINDVRKDDLEQVASATLALFEASGGSALGLFTAISRLRAVYDKIHAPLEDRSIALYAQHIDEIDTGTLVDMFREDLNACLLGTDAMRDGVDVPGESLRLIVFDRVPWPRPTILHKARRDYFAQNMGSQRAYDEMLTRLRLKQAFGRLIRKHDDRGVFVMLDSMLPSRLHGAFPEGVEIIKCGLSETVKGIRAHLGQN
ncbi:MAG: ATP-dependent DNA helicase [Alphaproteobacteria bacterium]|nr:ATP-dependent DNA helicase [Alphaproteobacteria bacterium]